MRTGELRQAEWAEFDLNASQWNIPAERMKMREPHLVPLADQAVTILRELHAPAPTSVTIYVAHIGNVFASCACA